MASKNTTQVLIGGKIYTMSGYESEEYLQRVATYLNNKITEIKAAEGYARMSQEMRSLLLNLNTADDYFKLKDKTDQLCESMSGKDKELYEIKHELISTQMKLETVTRELETEKEALLAAQQELTQLRTRLEDVRSGLGTAGSQVQAQTAQEGEAAADAEGLAEAPSAAVQDEAETEEKDALPEETGARSDGDKKEKELSEQTPKGQERAGSAGEMTELVKAAEPAGQISEQAEAKDPEGEAAELTETKDSAEETAETAEAKNSAEETAELPEAQEQEEEAAGKGKPEEEKKNPAPTVHINRKQKYNRYYRR